MWDGWLRIVCVTPIYIFKKKTWSHGFSTNHVFFFRDSCYLQYEIVIYRCIIYFFLEFTKNKKGFLDVHAHNKPLYPEHVCTVSLTEDFKVWQMRTQTQGLTVCLGKTPPGGRTRTTAGIPALFQSRRIERPVKRWYLPLGYDQPQSKNPADQMKAVSVCVEEERWSFSQQQMLDYLLL